MFNLTFLTSCLPKISIWILICKWTTCFRHELYRLTVYLMYIQINEWIGKKDNHHIIGLFTKYSVFCPTLSWKEIYASVSMKFGRTSELSCIFCFGRVNMGETGSKVVLRETSVDGVQPQVISMQTSATQPKHTALYRDIVHGQNNTNPSLTSKQQRLNN